MTQNIQKIKPYERLASYYDRLMDYIDYDIWIDDVEQLVAPYKPGSDWLDISCGTGSMALKLANRGRNMTAMDLSPDMVQIAKGKAETEKADIQFMVGDMINTKHNQTYDVIINLHDGLNYLLKDSDTQAFIENSHSLLNTEGILLFDVVTPLLCQTHFRGYREIFNDENGGYERQTNYDPVTQLAESMFTLNSAGEDSVDIESHIQKAYELSHVEEFCQKSPFKWWQILDDESLEEGTIASERFLVMMRKES